MPIIGTAGHVDHGKSTLVRALTGRDPDRWVEEQRRGLTIDLGFAWADLGDGTEVGFVDVPGHERFLKNMLAGVDGIDVALFVVAADAGWMPQSEEHLAVLDLLGVRFGVVALSRIDLVDADLAELAELEVEEKIEGTSLEKAAVVAVSAVTGQGVPELKAALRAALAAAPPPPDGGRPRLWVDRSFVISGAGTVVTGTLTDGTLRVGDTVAVWPGGHQARIRSIQSHEHTREEAQPGARTALNLVGLDRQEIARGAMVGVPDQWRSTTRVLVELRTVRSLEEPLQSRGAFHLHIGSGAWSVRLRVLETPTHRTPGTALIRLPEPLALGMGDRFIVRDVGRRAVVAGGRVLDPAPFQGGWRNWQQATALLGDALDAGADDRAAALLELRGRADVAHLDADSGGGAPPAGSAVAGVALSEAKLGELCAAMTAAVDAYHQTHPLRAGIPKASLASELAVASSLLERIIAATDAVIDDGATLRSATYADAWSDRDEEAWQRARSALLADGLAVPRAAQLDLPEELFHAVLRRGLAVKVGDDLVYLPEQLAEIGARLAAVGDGFSVAQARDALEVTRRQAVPLLEYLDRTGVTVREGDLRRLAAG